MSEKWEREIDELLRRREAKLRREPVGRRFARRSAPFRSSASGVARSILRRTPVEQFMIASIFLVAVAFLMNFLNFLPGAATIAQWASLLSLLLFVLAIALSVMGRRGSSNSSGKRWRDRDVSYGSSHPTVWDQLRHWWRRRRFRRL